MAVTDYGPLTTEDGSATFEIEAVRAAKGHLVARFRGIADRDTAGRLPQAPPRLRARAMRRLAPVRGLPGRDPAGRLANVRLFVPRERLPPLAIDEFYHADLIGLSAVTADGTEVGTVVAVHDFGAGDIVELLPPGGGTTIMLPFTAAFVPSVDIANGRIVVAPPESAPESRGGATE